MTLSDKLLFFHEKLAQFLHTHLRSILGFLALFIVLGLLYGGFVYYKSKKEKEAALKLMMAVKSNDIIKALSQFEKKYRGTQASLQARAILFDYYFQNENYQKAISFWKDLRGFYKKKKKALFLYGEAKILENEKKYLQALKLYQEIEKKEPKLRFLVYLDIARIAEKLDKKELAKKYYEKYLEEMPSKNKGFVEYKIAKLKM